MAQSAVAQEVLSALRRQVARIEGVLPERLAAADADAVILRGNGRLLSRDDLIATGIAALDETLGGGLPKAALTEIQGCQMRDAGAVSGFVLALVSLLLRQTGGQDHAPLLWIGTSGLFAETGFPYLHGLARLFGIEARMLLVAEAPKPVDALWIAEEAAGLKTLAAVIVELSGTPPKLDLTASRRLHRRAGEAGRPVFLIRHSARPQPTAAPLRFIVTPAPAGSRRVLGRPLEGSIGPPAFTVDLDKNRLAPPARFVLEWNADERTFEHRATEHQSRTQDPVAMVSLSPRRADMEAAARPRMAFGQFRFPALGHHQQ